MRTSLSAFVLAAGTMLAAVMLVPAALGYGRYVVTGRSIKSCEIFMAPPAATRRP